MGGTRIALVGLDDDDSGGGDAHATVTPAGGGTDGTAHDHAVQLIRATRSAAHVGVFARCQAAEGVDAGAAAAGASAAAALGSPNESGQLGEHDGGEVQKGNGVEGKQPDEAMEKEAVTGEVKKEAEAELAEEEKTIEEEKTEKAEKELQH